MSTNYLELRGKLLMSWCWIDTRTSANSLLTQPSLYVLRFPHTLLVIMKTTIYLRDQISPQYNINKPAVMRTKISWHNHISPRYTIKPICVVCVCDCQHNSSPACILCHWSASIQCMNTAITAVRYWLTHIHGDGSVYNSQLVIEENVRAAYSIMCHR